MYIQTANERGDRNEKRFGSFAVGFLYNIVTPAMNENIQIISEIVANSQMIKFDCNNLFPKIDRNLPRFIKGMVKSTPLSLS